MNLLSEIHRIPTTRPLTNWSMSQRKAGLFPCTNEFISYRNQLRIGYSLIRGYPQFLDCLNRFESIVDDIVNWFWCLEGEVCDGTKFLRDQWVESCESPWLCGPFDRFGSALLPQKDPWRYGSESVIVRVFGFISECLQLDLASKQLSYVHEW